MKISLTASYNFFNPLWLHDIFYIFICYPMGDIYNLSCSNI